MDRNPEGADQEPAAEAEGGGEHRAARPALLDPAAQHRGGKAEEEDGDREDPAEFGSFQSSGADWRRRQPGHRQIEDAERVNLADAQMNAKRRRGNHPTTEAGLGDRMTTIKIDKKPMERALPLFFRVRIA